MSYETTPPGVTAEQSEALHMDDAFILDTYGLGPAEVDTTVSFNGHTGTVRAMLANSACPVGRNLALGYQESGLAGVEAKLNSIKDFVPDFKLEISHKTREFHAGSLDRDQVFAKPDQTRQPDFLV